MNLNRASSSELAKISRAEERVSDMLGQARDWGDGRTRRLTPDEKRTVLIRCIRQLRQEAKNE